MSEQDKVPQQQQSQPQQQPRRYLAAFDFDYTVVAQNTDTVCRDLLPPEKVAAQSLSDIVEKSGWTEYMAEVFRRLHKHRITPQRIRDTIRGIPEVPGFVRLLKRLHKQYNFDLIIISDSNSIFIDEWLQAHNLVDCFSAIYTNPAEFDTETGLLKVQPYHNQTECKLSAPNLCKGRVLEHFVIEQDLRHNIRYEHVFYVGDGNNDICPVLRLRGCDFACARHGYAMEKNLIKNRNKLKLRAVLLAWTSGFDLLEQLEALPTLRCIRGNISPYKAKNDVANEEVVVANDGNNDDMKPQVAHDDVEADNDVEAEADDDDQVEVKIETETVVNANEH